MALDRAAYVPPHMRTRAPPADNQCVLEQIFSWLNCVRD